MSLGLGLYGSKTGLPGASLAGAASKAIQYSPQVMDLLSQNIPGVEPSSPPAADPSNTDSTDPASAESEAKKAADAGIKAGETLSLEQQSGLLNTNDPAIRSQLEALGLTDSQLDNKNTVFGITNNDQGTHLSYYSSNLATGERSGSVKLDATKNNFGVDFSPGGLGASGWKSYTDAAKNEAVLAGLKGKNYTDEMTRRNSFDSPEALRTSDALRSQLTALKGANLGGEKINDILGSLDSKKSTSELNALSDQVMSHLKAEENESAMAYLAGRRHGAMTEALELGANNKALNGASDYVFQNLKATSSDSNSTGLEAGGKNTISDAEIIKDYEDAFQAALDQNTLCIHQKGFTDTDGKIDQAKVTEHDTQMNTVLDKASKSEDKKIQALAENLKASAAKDADKRHFAYEKAELDHIEKLMGTNSEAEKKEAAAAKQAKEKPLDKATKDLLAAKGLTEQEAREMEDVYSLVSTLDLKNKPEAKADEASTTERLDRMAEIKEKLFENERKAIALDKPISTNNILGNPEDKEAIAKELADQNKKIADLRSKYVDELKAMHAIYAVDKTAFNAEVTGLLKYQTEKAVADIARVTPGQLDQSENQELLDSAQEQLTLNNDASLSPAALRDLANRVNSAASSIELAKKTDTAE